MFWKYYLLHYGYILLHDITNDEKLSWQIKQFIYKYHYQAVWKGGNQIRWVQMYATVCENILYQ